MKTIFGTQRLRGKFSRARTFFAMIRLFWNIEALLLFFRQKENNNTDSLLRGLSPRAPGFHRESIQQSSTNTLRQQSATRGYSTKRNLARLEKKKSLLAFLLRVVTISTDNWIGHTTFFSPSNKNNKKKRHIVRTVLGYAASGL
jgi:hypothetical protein